MKKSWKNIFSSKIKNRYLELKHIQRRASNSFSKCSNVSIAYFLPNCPRSWDIASHLVTCSELTWHCMILKVASIFLARARKTSLTFLKNKNFTSGQKHRERIGTAVPKHRKTSKTDQNSKSYPKKTEGWAFNSWTQFNWSKDSYSSTSNMHFTTIIVFESSIKSLISGTSTWT